MKINVVNVLLKNAQNVFSYNLVTEIKGYDDVGQRIPGTRFLQTAVFNVASRCFEKLSSRGFFQSSVKTIFHKISRCENLITSMMNLALHRVWLPLKNAKKI